MKRPGLVTVLAALALLASPLAAQTPRRPQRPAAREAPGPPAVQAPPKAAQQRTAKEPEKASDPSSAPGDSVTLDFQDADIRVVITTLAAAGGINVAYSSLPSIPLTMHLQRPIPRSAVRGLPDGILAANGLKGEEQNGVLRITEAAPDPVPQAAAPPAPSPARTGLPGAQGERLHIYRVKHARAPQLAATLYGLFGGGSGYAPTFGLSRTGLSDQLRAQQLPTSYAGLTGQGGGAATPAPSPTYGLAGGGQIRLQIAADEFSNSIVFRGSDEDWNLIREAIEALDVRPLQVLIEVLIAEVRRTRDFDLGLSLEVPEQRLPAGRGRAAGKIEGLEDGTIGVQLKSLGGVSADAVISALSSRADVNILSRPVILAQNNVEARILVGSQRPFIQVTRALPTDAPIRDQVIQYRDVGTSLAILPTINEDGYVNLQLVQEVSTATGETQFGAPVISTRQASTQLLVKNDQTVVLGGLIDKQQEQTRGGIPLLKDLPLLGWLFGSTQRSTFQTELFLFLTPHIVRSDEDVERLRRSIEEHAEEVKDRVRKERTLIPPDTTRSPKR
ncbi:MAG: hypothetical protein IRZ00_11300 [Gemmatimonadetes bacterium]|nr:hypothetical protein [Gemmatimonadota bacterium]